ncbi:MAG: dihydrodipicolinate synthase family protein [Gammaproteobacteria bacterium]
MAVVSDRIDESPSTQPGTHARAAGVWSPVLVPLRDDLGIDTQRFLTHAHWLLREGCHGLALFGTTSEATSFSVDERKSALEAVLAGGIEPQSVMIGVGCAALTDSVELTRHAVAAGVRRLLMLPPFYYKGVSDEGLHRSYATTLDRGASNDCELYFYHFPKLSGVPITHGLISRLRASHGDLVAGLKDSSGDWEHTRSLIEAFPDLAIFPGSESFLLRGLRAGGAGCITASANVNPAAIRGVYDAWRADAGDVDARDEAIRATRTAIEAHAMVSALKHITAHFRNDPAWRRTRPPLTELDARDGAALLESLATLGFAANYD